MSIEDAISAAEGLRDLLAQELARAEVERRHVRSLDASGLFGWATAREHFHAQIASHQDQLAQALRAAGARYRLPEVTIDRLAEVEPRLADRLAVRLEEIRSQAARLAEADVVNREIVARTLDCVRAYNDTLAPRTIAYDRRGSALAPSAGSTRRRSL